MQSGGGSHHAGGNGRSTVSPSSSQQQSGLGFDSIQNYQQQYQFGNLQSLQQQQPRKPEGNEPIIAFQATGLHGMMGGTNFVASPNSLQYTQSRNHEMAQQDSSHVPEQQQAINPALQAHMQYASPTTKQMSAMEIQNQGQASQQGDRGEWTESKSPMIQTNMGYSSGENLMRPGQIPQGQLGTQNMGSNQMMADQLRAWALENNIDLSQPENVNLMAQIMPLMQSRMIAQQNTNGVPRQQVTSPPVGNESSPHASSNSASNSGVGNYAADVPSQMSAHSKEIQGHSLSVNQGPEYSLNARSATISQDAMQMHNIRQLNQSGPQSGTLGADQSLGNHRPSQVQTPSQVSVQRSNFTKQQKYVLKAQILAFRRLKKGEGTLPQELLQAITPPPLEQQQQQQHVVTSNSTYQENSAVNESPKNAESSATREASSALYPVKEDQKSTSVAIKAEQELQNNLHNTPNRNELTMDGTEVKVSQVSVGESAQARKPQQKDTGSTRKYYGPLFDFPCFTRKHDSLGSAVPGNNKLCLAYDIKDLLSENGLEVLNNKRAENLRKIGGLLATNIERKRIRPDLVIRLQIEEKKLKLLDVQARLRDQVEQEQLEIMAMNDREYRKFVRTCERERFELSRHVQVSQKAIRDKQLKSIFRWRKKLLEAHWAIRDARTARNRGVAKYHERMLKEFSKRKDDHRNKRMEALKNNDVERYREMLLEQQTDISGDAAERYNVLSTFLTQTEKYLHKLGGKITAAKSQQEVQEAAAAAAAFARTRGLSEEEVRAAASCAGEEVIIRNQFSEMNSPRGSSSVNKYYSLAHAINEKVYKQPSILRAGILRDYQLVGLQWMVSLYNNKLNGILADEMGLGKTVQVMALIAYLMECKGNNGPHLIIVPNAVLVNWKSELHTWLPSVACIYYVGSKEQRAKLFSQEVRALKFNVLVTTYEFIMFDRTKLSKIDWKYIIIDEAQRMKDRESVLARDLDRYRCQRRLLLTGTPLQNDLKELWSLLNLLLPEVFDNRKAFHDWFSQPFQKEAMHNAEDDWLETEKKVIIIHRLHQILEPFMLRRRVEDVEGSLPPKVSFVLKCKMSALQGVIYDWVKATGTLRVDPEDEDLKAGRNPNYQARVYKTLHNRCTELRKLCNHPLLSYPYFNDLSKEFLVKSCGKLWILDRILVKLHRSGHRVLLFSTMTKLLDILEEYLQWRRLVYRRIDGTTTLEDRESHIVEFNNPETDCFIFLLSIRAAGRGLNLQTADTVIIYDPDPNPKNEEQAVARAHRIGQKREVKVIYLEAVVDKIASHQKEDESEDDRYIGSIESLIRNNIQQYKIEMADEVINAGRFDQRTTHEERRMTLETLLHDEERGQETVHDVPSLKEVNRLIARSEEEVELFDQMDEEFDWVEMTKYDEIPEWLCASAKEVNDVVTSLAQKPSKNILNSANKVGPSEPEKKRGRGKRKKNVVYTEVDDDIGIFSDEGYEDGNKDLVPNEDHEDGDYEDEEEEEDATAEAINEQSEEDIPISNHAVEESGSPESSSSQKFTTLSAIDARPNSGSKGQTNDQEEGDFVVSGDSHMDIQQSGSWNQEREEGDDEQVLQKPKITRKRSIRLRPQHTMEREERYSNEKPSLNHGDSSRTQSSPEEKLGGSSDVKQDQRKKPSKTTPGGSSRKTDSGSKLHASTKPGRVNRFSSPHDEDSRDSWDDNQNFDVSINCSDRSKMSDIIQRRCKNVLSKVQRRIDKEGKQIVPLLTEFWKKIELSGVGAGNKLLDLRKIHDRLDKFHYGGVMEFAFDVQSMLKNAVQHYSFSHEVRCEARKVQDLFFDIIEMSFPDIDFQEAKNSLSTSGPKTTAPSLRKQRSTNDINPETSPSPNQLGRGPSMANKGSRTRSQPDDSFMPTHPGDLVVCKRKRKDREKPTGNTRPTSRPVSPVSPPSMSRSLKSPGSVSTPRETRSGLQGSSNQSGQGSSSGGVTFGWANPAKRLRTDSGKRRPSFM